MQSCPDNEGARHSKGLSNGCESTLVFMRQHDGVYEMFEHGCFGVTGIAQFEQCRISIDWPVLLCTGPTEVQLDNTCNVDDADTDMPANFLSCSGRQKQLLRRFSPTSYGARSALAASLDEVEENHPN